MLVPSSPTNANRRRRAECSLLTNQKLAKATTAPVKAIPNLTIEGLSLRSMCPNGPNVVWTAF